MLTCIFKLKGAQCDIHSVRVVLIVEKEISVLFFFHSQAVDDDHHSLYYLFVCFFCLSVCLSLFFTFLFVCLLLELD